MATTEGARRLVPSWIIGYALVSFIIAIRPLIDLGGRYEGSALNPGGAAGLFVSFICITISLLGINRIRKGAGVTFLAYAAICLIGFVNFLTGPYPESTMVNLARFSAGYAPSLLLFAVPDVLRLRESAQSDARRLVLLLIAASAIPVSIAWLQFAGTFPFSYFDYVAGARVGRPSGGYFQPNSLARLLVFVVIFTAALEAHKRLPRFAALSVIVVAIATLLITTHRTSVFSLVVIGSVFAHSTIAETRRTARFRRSIIGIAIVACGSATAFTLFAPVVPAALVNRVSQSVAVVISVFPDNHSSDLVNLRGRGEIWGQVIGDFSSAPLPDKLFGVGAAAVEPHNEILNAVTLHGAIGLALLALIHISTISFSLKRTAAKGRVFVLASASFYVLFSFTLQPLDYPFFMWLHFSALWLAMTLFPDAAVRTA